MAIYLDSSALVKLIAREDESAALLEYIADHTVRVSSVLARIEVGRAARVRGGDTIRRSRRLLQSLHLVGIDEALMAAAVSVDPEFLRSLDSIHVATAIAIRDEVAAVVTYDRRMAEAASANGFVVESPGAAS